MDRLEEINNRYKTAIPQVSSSLISFLKNNVINEWLNQKMSIGRILEIGCGTRSIFEDWERLFPRGLLPSSIIEACDISNVAIEKATSSPESDHIDYYVQDILRTFSHDDYKCVVDGHCLHSLTSLPELFHALGNIRQALDVGGIFMGEVMMAHKNMNFKPGFEYFENECVLYKNENPSRVFLDATGWEDLFINCGFNIKYFMCQSSIKFIPDDLRNEALPGDPECLRFVLEVKGSESYE